MLMGGGGAAKVIGSLLRRLAAEKGEQVCINLARHLCVGGNGMPWKGLASPHCTDWAVRTGLTVEGPHHLSIYARSSPAHRSL